MRRTSLWIAGLAIFWAVSAAAIPKAELHIAGTAFHGEGGCCCWDFDVFQHWGEPGNIMYIDAQVTTPGVTVTSVSGPVPGPSSSSPALLSASSVRWFLPVPDGLWNAPQTLTACFGNVPASGATLTLTGYDSAGNTTALLQASTLVGENGECEGLPDLWMKDTMAPDLPEDFGAEPNTVSTLLYISRDIWVRTNQDTLVPGGSNPGPDTAPYYSNEHNHQNPVHFNATQANYVYVKVRNRGTQSSAGTEVLRVYWADASTGLPWPGSGVWNELDCDASSAGSIEPCQLPVIANGQDYVAELPWVPPNPISTNHYCLVARIETQPAAPFGMTFPEGSSLWQNVASNNNIAWKNCTVVRASTYSQVIVRNTLPRPAALELRFTVPEGEWENPFLRHGFVVVDLGDAVMRKWRKGGGQGHGFTVVGRNKIKITGLDAVLLGLRFARGEAQTIKVQMQLRQGDNSRPGTTFNYDVIQLAPLRREAAPTLIGGERYIFNVGRTAKDQ